MLRIAIGIALLTGLVPVASATSWARLDPEEFAKECPVIVRGTIISVGETKPGVDRVDVVIRIEEIVKNILSDTPLKVGGDLTTHRNVGARLSGSEDLDYPVKTRALWMVTLHAERSFHVDGHPVHRQPANLVLDLGATKFYREPGVDFPRAPVTQKQWMEERRLAAAWQSRTPDQEKARKLELFTVSKDLTESPFIDEKSMRAVAALPKDRRRDFVHFAHFVQPLKGEKLGDAIAHMLAHDADDEIRAHAAHGLADREVAPGESAKRALVRALADPSARVRHSACVALFNRKETGCGPAFAALLRDEDRLVRFLAVRALGRRRDVRALPTILAMYEREKADPVRELTFVESLANLGETKVVLIAARRALDSENIQLRHAVVDSLRSIDSKLVVPVAMEWLASELRGIFARQPGVGFNTGRYASLCYILTRSGQKHTTDPSVWFDWWDKTRAEYEAPPLKIDREAVRKVYGEYLRAMEDIRRGNR